MSGREIAVAGHPVRALRVSYVGELGWELHAPMASMAPLYEALWSAGQPFGIANYGLYAVNSMRIEKGYKAWSTELTNELNMLEADMSRFIDFDKGEFTGRSATLAHCASRDAPLAFTATAPLVHPGPRQAEPQQAGPREAQAPRPLKIVYLEIGATDTDARGGEPLLREDHCIGVVTSGAYGHRVGKSLAFACVAPQFAAPGSTFEILIQGERRPATVRSTAAFDPDNHRMRA